MILSLFDHLWYIAHGKILKNIYKSNFTKRCLLKYTPYPFLTSYSYFSHQQQWQSRCLSGILHELGFIVDVIHYAQELPNNEIYDLVIDIHPQAKDHYKNHLRPGGKVCAYLTGSNPSQLAEAEQSALEQIREVTSVSLPSRRTLQASYDALNTLDKIIVMGNSTTLHTYDSVISAVDRVALINNTAYPDLITKTEWSKKRIKSFVYIGGNGQALKGLHILLWVFHSHPDWHLHIFSDLKSEPEFTRAFKRELQSDNIHLHGQKVPSSKEVKNITNTSVFMLFPSRSEGMSGSVLTAMSLGLIPLVSKESGVDAEGLITVPDFSPGTWEKSIVDAMQLSQSALVLRQRMLQGACKVQFSPQNYKKRMKKLLTNLHA